MAVEEFKVRVGVELDNASFNALKNQINGTVQKEPIKVRVDTKEAENSVKSLKTQIESLGKTNISLSGATKIEASLKEISNSVKEIKTSLSSLNGVSVKPKIDTADVDKKIANTKLKVKTLESIPPVEMKANTGNIDSAISSVSKKISVTVKNVEELKNRLNGDFGFDPIDTDKLIAGLDDAVIKIGKIKAELEGDNSLKITVTGEDDIQRAFTIIKKFKGEVGENGEVVNWKLVGDETSFTNNLGKLESQINKISKELDSGKIDTKVRQIGRSFDELGVGGSKAFSDMEAAFTEFKAKYDAWNVSSTKSDPMEIQDVIRSYEKLTNTIERASYEARNVKLTTIDEIQRQTDISKLETWMNENTKAAELYGQQLDIIKNKLATLDDPVAYAKTLKEKNLIQQQARSSGNVGLTFKDSLTKKFKEYASYFSVASLAIRATQSLREMYQQVLETDTAMTELRRVTDLTSTQYSTLYDNMIASAKEYGATLTDIINSTADWSRAGFDANTANELAGITMMYEHIADVDYEEATKNLLTSYKGFQGQLDEQFNGDASAAVTHIADVLNELDNNYSVTAAGIGEAMRRSAASMDIANNSMEQTAALVTGAVEVTQDPEGAGNALKVVSMRLRGAKGELEELGEEVDSNVENLTQMQGKILNLTHGHVNIFEDNGDFKSTYDILKGIYEVWDDLTDLEQADLLETVAGKHRANTVASILGNFEDVEKAYQSALNSAGSAEEENAKYMDSLQGHLNQLETAWQSFSNTFMSSDFLKGCVDVLTTILELLDKLIENVGTLGTIGLGAFGFGVFKYFKNYSGIFKGLITSSNDVGEALKNGVVNAAENAANAVSNAGNIANGARAGFSVFAKSLTGVLSIAGITVAGIGLVISQIDNYYKKKSEERQKDIEESNKFLDSFDSFEQVYVKYSGKTQLTEEEEEELKTAINGTVTALDDKNSALNNVVNTSSDYLASLEEISNAEKEAARNAANLKKDQAAKELEQLAKGWTDLDGSEIDVMIKSDDGNEQARELAEKIGGEYYNSRIAGSDLYKYTKYGFKIDANASADEIVDYYNMLVKYRDELSEAGLSSTAEFEKTNEVINKLTETVGVYTEGIYDAAKANYQFENGIPKTVDEYLKMRKSIIESIGGSMNTRSSVATTLDKEYGQIFDLTDTEVQARKLIGVVEGFDEEQVGKFELFLNMRSSVNNGECTVGEYIDSLNEINDVISRYDKETQDLINLTFGLDTDTIQKQYNDFVEKMSKSVGKEDAEKFLGSLTKTELSAAIELDADAKINWDNISVGDLRQMIEDEANYIKAMNFSIDIEAETSGIESFNTALSETRSAIGLTEDSIESLKSRYKNLDGYDAAKLFEETATGVRLNTEEVNRLEQAYADTNLEDIDNNLKILKDEYDELGIEIQNCSDINKRAELYGQQEETREKINALAEEAAAYEGLTNAYAKWQNAESASTNRDMYSNVQSAMEGVKEELDLGWIDDGTKEYFDLIWGGNWNSAGKGIEDYRARWATLDDIIEGTTHSIQDFFKTDEDGNVTSEGITNFFDAVRQKQEQLGQNWLEFDEQGNLTTIDLGVNGEQAIADALGISEELVDIFIQASKDAGFVVTIDGKYTQLADLQNRAEEAAKTLKELGKTDFDFDFDTTSLQSVQEQLVEAKTVLDQFKNEDGTIKTEFIKSDGSFTEDAQAAIDVMSTLTAMADKLSEPKYMQLKTNQVEDSLQEPLKDMQEFEELCQEKHQFEITGKNTDEIDQQMSEIVTSLYSLSNETKIKLGIDGLTPEEIQQKLEAGEIEIPATVDIQMEMSDDLKDIRALLMYQAGKISDEELTLMVDFDFDTSQIDNLTPEEQTVLVDFMPDTSDIDSYTPEEIQTIVRFVKDIDDINGYTPEQKSAIVKYIKDIDDIESYTPAEKKVVCDFIVNNDDVMNYTPEEKSAIAQYMVDPSNVDSFTPEQKEAVAKFIAEHGNVDSWSPEDRMAIARFLLNNAEVEGYQPSDKYPTVRYRKDSSEPDSYQPSDENPNVNYHVNSSEVDSYNPPDKHMTVWATIRKVASDLWNNLTGGGGSSGGTKNKTARVDGTAGRAFKQGDWGTNDSGKALVGELGQELLVRDGHYYTIGDNGAEFIDYKKGDIIFNAGQTKQLFEQGKIVNGQTRGRAYAGGNVFDSRVNNSSLINLSGVTSSTGVFNLDVLVREDGVKETTSDLNDLNNAASETKNYTGEKFKVDVDDYGIQSAIEWLDELNGYIEESASSTGLSTDSMEAIVNQYKDLDGFDMASLFQESATGIQLNTNAVKKYEQQMAKAKLDKINKTIKDQKREYYNNAKLIKLGNSSLVEHNNYLREQIKANEALAASYDGVISKYNQWVEASSQTKQREPYDNINNELDNALDLLDRGWLGDEEVTSFLDLIYGDNYNIAGKTSDEVAADLRNKMKQSIEGTSYSIGDFFTYDDDGNTTADGYFNMLDAIMQKQQELGKNWVQMDENGNYTFDFGVNGLDEIAEAFGVSKDLIALILQAGRDAGHEVNFGGVIEDIDALEQKATSAVDKLHEIGATDYQFDLDTSDVDSLTEQLDVANGVLGQFRNEDGTINMNADGVQEAIELVQYLTAQMDLANSHYIGIKTDDESLQEPLEKLQDFEILTSEINSLNINPQVNADEITATEQKVQEVVDYFAGLDGETLAKLGFNFEGLTQEEIQQQITDSIKNGTVTIPVKAEVESTGTTDGSTNGTITPQVEVDPNFVKSELSTGVFSQIEEEVNTYFNENPLTPDSPVNPDLVLSNFAPDEVYGQAKNRLDTYLSEHPLTLDSPVDMTVTYGDVNDDSVNEYKDGHTYDIGDAKVRYNPDTGLIEVYNPEKDSWVTYEPELGEIDALTEEELAKSSDVIYDPVTDSIDIYDFDKKAFVRYYPVVVNESDESEFSSTNNNGEEYNGEEYNGEDKRIGVLDSKSRLSGTENNDGFFYEAISSVGEIVGNVVDKAGTALYNGLQGFDKILRDPLGFLSSFGVKQANASESSNREETGSKTMTDGRVAGGGHSTRGGTGSFSSQSEDASQSSGKSGGRSYGKESNNKATTQAEIDITTVDSSKAPKAEIGAEAEIDTVNASDAPEGEVGVTGELTDVEQKSPFQIAVDDSGIQDVIQDGAALKETLLGLDDGGLLTIGNMMLPGLSEAVTDAGQMRDIINNMSSDGLVNIFTNTGIEDALADAEAFNDYLNNELNADEQRQVVIDLVLSKNSEGQEPTVTPVVDSGPMDSEIEKPRDTTAVVHANDSLVQSVMTRGYSTIAKIIPQLTTSTLTVAINTVAKTVAGNSSSKANGTAYASGTVGKAFKHGNWGAPDSGKALVGELGQEMVVRDGRFFTVGDNGAEFFDYKKGDIIFNAGQTKQLFEQGKIVNGQTRGRAYVNGTAFSVGTASGGGGRRPKTTMSGSRGTYTGSGGSSSGSSSGSDSGGDSSDEADDFEETLDWIETKLDRIERAVSKLDTTASSVYKNWGTRNEALVNQISKVGEEINLQQRAYDRYLQQANSVGLSEDYASKVRDGTIDIETITDEDLNDKISEYKEW